LVLSSCKAHLPLFDNSSNGKNEGDGEENGGRPCLVCRRLPQLTRSSGECFLTLAVELASIHYAYSAIFAQNAADRTRPSFAILAYKPIWTGTFGSVPRDGALSIVETGVDGTGRDATSLAVKPISTLADFVKETGEQTFAAVFAEIVGTFRFCTLGTEKAGGTSALWPPVASDRTLAAILAKSIGTFAEDGVAFVRGGGRGIGQPLHHHLGTFLSGHYPSVSLAIEKVGATLSVIGASAVCVTAHPWLVLGTVHHFPIPGASFRHVFQRTVPT